MECLFKNNFRPPTRLIKTILILGISSKTIRKMLLQDGLSTTPELIFQLPAAKELLKELPNDILKAIFNPFTISLKSSPEYPKYFSTSLYQKNGNIEYLHCLMIYEEINPVILELSKERRNSPGLMRFVINNKIKESEINKLYYVPIVICIKTSSKYIDVFNDILSALYGLLHSIDHLHTAEKNCIISNEFIKYSLCLLNDLIIPPPAVKMMFNIGKKQIIIPIEYPDKIHFFESNVIGLIDLLDIRNIIKA